MYLYQKGQEWALLQSTLDDAQSFSDLQQRLHKLGFPEATEFRYRVGSVHFYTRHATGLKRTPLPFHFCCVLELAGYHHCIGMKSLEDALAFLTAIDACSLEAADTHHMLLEEIETLRKPLAEIATTLQTPLVINALADLKLIIEHLVNLVAPGGLGVLSGSHGLPHKEQRGVPSEHANRKTTVVSRAAVKGTPPTSV